ncbi:Nucleolysin TIAR [Cichlidogyrus casuarinus]|uniref:Nucleolysin TIAR n=1 Tax=Cichlidogyrus casuarinus TaxID=1844966 RepID=A0ABD2QE11_9PLAT
MLNRSRCKDVSLSVPLNINTNQKIDTTNHYHIFVGDLSPEVENKELYDAFANFGLVTECKIIKDMHTQKPKGYGFVAYATKEEAELAIQRMNGQIVGSRPIRTGWAVRKPSSSQPKGMCFKGNLILFQIKDL